jgi:colanic acid biosynthesis glycosyl transferase WcaI
MSTTPRLFFVNRFYWPDEPATAQLLTDLAEALAARGHAVTVITSHPREPGCPVLEKHNGVEILRIRGSRLGHRNLVGRLIDFLSFSAGALRMLSARVKTGDSVVLMTDPPLLGCTATSVAWKRGAHVIHWIQDIYPEIATAVSGRKLPLLFRAWRNRTWRRADRCVVLGNDMARFVAACGVMTDKILVSPNWAPTGLAPWTELTHSGLRAEWGLEGKFIVGYSGNLGRVHDLDPVLAIAEALRNEPGIAFVFIGDGAQKPRLQSAVAAQQLTNVFFKPAQPRYRLGEVLSLPDLHLVTLRTGCEQLVFPSKLYGITAVGRPVLFIGPPRSEMAMLVKSEGIGLTASREESEAAAAAIRLLRADATQQTSFRYAAIRFWESKGRLEHALAIWSSLFAQRKPLAGTECNTPVSDQ